MEIEITRSSQCKGSYKSDREDGGVLDVSLEKETSSCPPRVETGCKQYMLLERRGAVREVKGGTCCPPRNPSIVRAYVRSCVGVCGCLGGCLFAWVWARASVGRR
jgi:hypothetical protein